MTTPPNRHDENTWGAPPTTPRPSRPSGPVAQPQGWAQPQAPAYGQPPGQAPGPQYGQQPHYGQQPQYGQQPHYGQQPQYGAHAAHGDVPPASVAERQDAEAIRRQFIKHEASVRSIGTFYIIVAVVQVLASSYLLAAAIGIVDLGELYNVALDRTIMLSLGVAGVAFAAVHGIMGVHLRRLDPRVRKPAIWFIAASGILGLLRGRSWSLVSAYCVYMLVCDKGTYVLSEEYARIRALTPHIRYQSKVFLVVVFLLLALIVLVLSL